MKKFKILPILLAILMFATMLPVSAMADESEPEITANAAVLADAATGEIYYSKNSDKVVHPASTTKMLMALLVLEAVDRGEIALTDEVTASQNCQYNLDEYSSHADPVIEPGEVMTVENLLYCAMLLSANEACNILAEHVSGSVDAFVDTMNARADELGCQNTHFVNTNGLEDPDHYTTAADFAKIAQAAVQNSTLMSICGTLHYTVPATNVAAAREMTNTNSLLNPNSDYYYEYAYGIKTGYFTNAGYCLVSASAYDEMDVVCVVLGSEEKGDHFADTLAIFDWFYDTYSNRQILSSTQTLMPVTVELGTEDSTGVRADTAVTKVLPKDYETTDLKYSVVLYHEMEGRPLEAPVNAGEVLGEVTVLLDGEECGTAYLVATSTVEMSRMEYLRSQSAELFQTPVIRRIITLLICLLGIYVLLVLFYYWQRVRHLRSVRRAKRARAARQAREEAQWLDFPEVPDDDYEMEYFQPGDGTEERGSASQDNYFDSFYKD